MNEFLEILKPIAISLWPVWLVLAALAVAFTVKKEW